MKGAVCIDGLCRQVCSSPEQCPTGDGCVAETTGEACAETGFRVTYARQCPSCTNETPIVTLVGVNEVHADLTLLYPSTSYQISVEAM